MYCIPILHDIPILGNKIAHDWLWTVGISPGFLGQGIITGPAIPFHMLLGAILVWGILSPYAKHQGWALGDVDDWETGSRGWIIWVSLATLLADASVKLAWLLIRLLWNLYWSSAVNRQGQGWPHIFWRPVDRPNNQDRRASQNEAGDQTLLNQEVDGLPGGLNELPGPAVECEPYRGLASFGTLGLAFCGSVLVCVLGVHLIFGNIIPWFYTVLAIVLSLPMAVVGIRSLAETDYNPETALGMALSGLRVPLADTFFQCRSSYLPRLSLHPIRTGRL